MQSWLRFEIDGRELRAERVSIHQTLADFLDANSLAELGFSWSSDEGEEYGGRAGVRPPSNEPWQGGRLIGMLDTTLESDADRHADPGGVAEAVAEIEAEKAVPKFRIVDASLLLLVQAADRRFVTARGLSRQGPSHPVIAELAAHPLLDSDGDGLANVFLCLFEGWQRSLGGDAVVGDPRFLSEQVDACLGRSTDYPRLRQVATKLFQLTSDDGKENSGEVGGDAAIELPEVQFIDRDKRRWFRPQTILEALKFRQQHPTARWVGGGTDLGEAAWRKTADWGALITLDGISEMRSIFESSDDEIEIGAGASLTRIADRLGSEFPIFPKILRRFGSRAVRNQATLGGHLASASSTGDLWPVLMVLNARVRLVSLDGERDVPVASFSEGPGKTNLRASELISSIIVPRATSKALAKRGATVRLCDAYKVARRRHLARAILAAGFCVELDSGKLVKNAVLAYSGVSERPVRAKQTEESLLGKPWDERTVIGALQALDKEIEVTLDDELAGRAYRRQVVITLFQKFFYQHSTATGTARELGAVGEMLSMKEQGNTAS